MTESINALTRYTINQLHVKRIEIRCDKNNIQSKKIPEKLNYQLEAILKSNRISVITNTISDTLVFVKQDMKGLPDLAVILG